MRKRWVEFCDNLVSRSAEKGAVDDDVLAGAAADTFVNFNRDTERARKAAIRKAKSLLRAPEIRAQIGLVYERHGFSIVDAVEKHVEHINAGNYQALKDYLAMVMPKEPLKVKVSGISDGPLPVAGDITMKPRVLSTSVSDK